MGYLISKGLVRDSPLEVAKFIHGTGSLARDKVNTYKYKYKYKYTGTAICPEEAGGGGPASQASELCKHFPSHRSKVSTRGTEGEMAYEKET